MRMLNKFDKMIDWSKQHCGVHQATNKQLLHFMPDLREIIDTFPDDPKMFHLGC